VLHLCPNPSHVLSMTTAAFIALCHRQGGALGPKNAQRISQAAPRALFPPQPQPEVHRRLFYRELQRAALYQHAIEELTTPLADLVRHTPARHVACRPGASESLVAHVLAAIEDWPRVPSGRARWATAGFAPSPCHAGTSGHATPNVSKIGGPHLRQAMYVLTTSLVWHEPPVGIPCCQRVLPGKPCVPTIMHLGRQVANTALAMRNMAQPFRPRWAEPQAAKACLPHVQDR
jgi:hypothetical protein